MIVLKHLLQLKWRKATSVKYTHMHMWCDDDFEYIHAKRLIPMFLHESRGSIVQTVHTCLIAVCCFTKKYWKKLCSLFAQRWSQFRNTYYFVKVWFLPPPAKCTSQCKIYTYLPPLKRYYANILSIVTILKSMRKMLRWKNRYKCPNLWK